MIVYVISWLRQTDGCAPSDGIGLKAFKSEEEAKDGLVKFLEEERSLLVNSPEDEANIVMSVDKDGMSGIIHDRWYTDTYIARILDVEVEC